MIKTLFKHVIIEQAISVLFDGFTKNLQTVDNKYKVGTQYQFLDRFFTNKEYAEETGIYYHNDVVSVHISYQNPRIIEHTGNFINFVCDSIDVTTYSQQWNVIQSTSHESKGSIFFQISLIEKEWSLG